MTDDGRYTNRVSHAPRSAHLRFRRLTAVDLPAWHELLTDPHVRRYLLDGVAIDLDRTRALLAASDRLFAEVGLGMFLLFEDDGDTPIGFAGFHVFPEVWNEPELVFALLESRTGRGLATEAARSLIAFARDLGHGRVLAAADAPNAASLRVLEKLGFRQTGTLPGAFGDTLLFALGELEVPSGAVPSDHR